MVPVNWTKIIQGTGLKSVDWTRNIHKTGMGPVKSRFRNRHNLWGILKKAEKYCFLNFYLYSFSSALEIWFCFHSVKVTK